jgi:hypothetical protein
VTKRLLVLLTIAISFALVAAVFNPVVLAQGNVSTSAVDPVPVLSAEPVIMRFEEGITIKWNTPVSGFTYTLPTGMQSRLWMMPDGKTGLIRIVNYEQGQNFDLAITDAWGVNGRRLLPSESGYIQKVITPVPLKIDITPAAGTTRVANLSEVTMNFSEAVVNPDSMNTALSIDPPVPGALKWMSATQAVFTPSSKWGFETPVTVKIKGGPAGPAGSSGSYIDRTITNIFTTMPQKMIDLNLSEQKLYCYEEGALVFECWVATGKAGYRTRAGDFRIYAKDRYVDMQNSPGEEAYLVTDVPFVNWFSGGMAIHGCYWSSEYGYPRSHGCVNVTVGNAEWIFNWAPIGTPVFSHY